MPDFFLLRSVRLPSSTWPCSSFGECDVNLENLAGLIISFLVGGYILYCLFRPEDL